MLYIYVFSPTPTPRSPRNPPPSRLGMMKVLIKSVFWLSYNSFISCPMKTILKKVLTPFFLENFTLYIFIYLLHPDPCQKEKNGPISYYMIHLKNDPLNTFVFRLRVIFHYHLAYPSSSRHAQFDPYLPTAPASSTLHQVSIYPSIDRSIDRSIGIIDGVVS